MQLVGSHPHIPGQVGSHSGAERQAEVLVGLQDSVGAQHSHPSPVISLNFSE